MLKCTNYRDILYQKTDHGAIWQNNVMTEVCYHYIADVKLFGGMRKET